MATNLDERTSSAGADSFDPAQRYYDDTFNRLTSAEHMAQEGQSRGSSAQSRAQTLGRKALAAGERLGLEDKQDGSTRSKLLHGGSNWLKGGTGKLFNSVTSHKWAWGLGAGSLLSALGLLLLLFIFLSTLKVPNLAENIIAYQFSRTFKMAAENNERAIGTKIALDSADDSIYGKLKARYNTAGSKVGEKWSKLDKYRPNKVISNLGGSDQFKLNYNGTTLSGRQRLVGITMGDHSLLVRNSTPKNLIPGYKFVNNIKLASEVRPTLESSMQANQIGPIVRGLTAKEIRQRLGISLLAWQLGKFKDTDRYKARLVEAREAHEKIKTDSKTPLATKSLEDGKQNVQQATESTVGDDKKFTQVLDQGGDIEAARNAATDAAKTSGYSEALQIANGVYGVALPACIIYDGSIDHSGGTIDANSTAQMKEYQYIASAADQQKDGTNASAMAVGALNDRLGDDSTSLPLQRASGRTADTSSTTSAQASSMGDFSLFNVLLGNNQVTDLINGGASSVCSTLTSSAFIYGGVALNIVGFIGSGGTSSLLEGTAQLSLKAAAKKVTDNIGAKFVEKLGSKAALKTTTRNAVGKTNRFLYDSAKSGVKIGGMTLIAKMIVANQAGYFHNGIDTDDDTANNADAGGFLMANEVNREQMYGRPLDKTEASQAAAESVAYASDQNAQKSAYERYLALDNPQSLLATTGTTVYGSLSHFSIGQSVAKLGSAVASMPSLVGNSLFMSSGKAALAAGNNATSLTYGNVSWGYSAEESALMKKPAYSMLENQRLLDASGKEDEIAGTYGKCFSGDTTQGTLLQDGDIQRDEDGNVVANDSLCSPKNLGPHNQDPQSPCGKSGCGDLVFRWRLAQRDEKSLGELDHQQEITADSAADGCGDTAPGAPTCSSIGAFRIMSVNAQNGISHKSTANHICAKTNGSTGNACLEQKSKILAKLIQGNQTGKASDVVGMQEQNPIQLGALKTALGADYQSYPAAYSSNQGSERTIIWNSKTFQLIRGGTLGYPWYGGVDYMPWVKLGQLDGSGKVVSQIYVYNTHPVSGGFPVNKPVTIDGETYSTYADKRAGTARIILKDIQSRDTDNTPVFITGDMNSTFSVRSDKKHKDTTRQLLPYCIFTAAGTGIAHAQDLAKHKPGQCPSMGGPIDHIYASRSVGIAGYQSVSGGLVPETTDHGSLIVADVKGSTANNSATSSTASSSPVGNDGFGGGYCTTYVEYILARHSTKYRSGSLGDGKDVANSLGRFGYTVNQTPAVHATVSFPGPPHGYIKNHGYAGHVGLVAGINPDGSLIIEESNWNPNNPMRYGTHVVKKGSYDYSRLVFAHTEVGWH